MIITICGSMQFYKEMRKAKKTLEESGYEVYVPKGLDLEDAIPIEAQKDLSKEEIVAAKIEHDFIKDHFRRIDMSDAILVLNYEKKDIPNYIGGNTFLEIGVAYWLGKTIYFLHPVPDAMEYAVEMHAMQPVILHGDLKAITN